MPGLDLHYTDHNILRKTAGWDPDDLDRDLSVRRAEGLTPFWDVREKGKKKRPTETTTITAASISRTDWVAGVGDVPHLECTVMSFYRVIYCQ